MVWTALEAAEKLAEEGVSVEVVDLRTLLPLDRETVCASVKKTSKVCWCTRTRAPAAWRANWPISITESSSSTWTARSCG